MRVILIRYNDCYGNGDSKTIEGYVNHETEFYTWLEERNKTREEEGECTEGAEEFDLIELTKLN
jgi:hypothetical protein